MITTKISVTQMIPNRNEIPFFTAIQGSSCVMSPTRFMSDDVDNYLSCTWHIDKVWRKALAETVRQRRAKKIYCQLVHYLLKKRNLNVELIEIMYKRALSFVIFNSILCMFHQSIGVNKMYE